MTYRRSEIALSKIFSFVTVAAVTSLAVSAAFFGCGSLGATATGDAGTGTVDPTKCPVCVTDQDCNDGVCAQFGSDIFCAPSCANGGSCASDRSCSIETSATGDQVSVCIPNGEACGSDDDPDAGPSGCDPVSSTDAGDPNRCGSFVGPAEAASCASCSGSSSTCQANGCYGGWWCDTNTDKCQASPSGCTPGGGSGGGSSSCAFDAGSTPITGNVGINGGTASRLYFGIIGDTRPANPDDTSAYPTSIITKIYSDVNALNPKPLFVVTSGDYMFATPGKGNAAPQMNLYLTAQKIFTGTAFPAMGNHECTGATSSNCATTATENMNVFMSQMIAPLGVSKPYYAVNIQATDNSWTAKFVFIAANAWDSAQSTWLEGALSPATTYTFVVRHEPSEANTAPGVTPSDAILTKHPYTLLLTGHTHTYSHYSSSPKQIVIGNGGAPPTGSKDYGFGLVEQRADGTIQVDVLDYQSLLFDPQFRFAVHPDGSPAPL